MIKSLKWPFSFIDYWQKIINYCPMRKLSTLILSLLMVVSVSVFMPSAHAANKTLKNLYFSMTFPATVKMPKGDCGSFTVSYKLGIKAKQVGFGQVTSGVLVDTDLAAGTYWTLGLAVGTDLKDSGKAKWKFCKEDWLTEDEDARIGISPGTYKIGFVSDFNDDEQEKWGTIKFTK
jgi:hypothetical protein